MTRRKPRGLRPDEEKLWEMVRHTTTPMHQSKREVLKASIERPKPAKPTQPVQSFRVGESSTAIPAMVPDHPSANRVHMDHKRFGKMKRGKLSPDGRIDLHGMTTAQAHPALTSFIMQSHAQGKRLVLVITGKGKSSQDEGPIPVRMGVLRHQVPGWLRSPHLGQMILQISEAHLKHGGSGAYYVYLRRRR